MTKTEKIILWSLVSLLIVGAGFWFFKKPKNSTGNTNKATQSPGAVQPTTGATKAPVVNVPNVAQVIPTPQQTQQTNFNSGSIAAIATGGASVLNNLIDSFGNSGNGTDNTGDNSGIYGAVVDTAGNYSNDYVDPLAGVSSADASQYLDEYSN